MKTLKFASEINWPLATLTLGTYFFLQGEQYGLLKVLFLRISGQIWHLWNTLKCRFKQDFLLTAIWQMVHLKFLFWFWRCLSKLGTRLWQWKHRAFLSLIPKCLVLMWSRTDFTSELQIEQGPGPVFWAWTCQIWPRISFISTNLKFWQNGQLRLNGAAIVSDCSEKNVFFRQCLELNWTIETILCWHIF